MRAGDLDNRGMGSSEEVMLAGARMHRKLQKDAGEVYQAEVPLSIAYEIPEKTGQTPTDSKTVDGAGTSITVLVEGRADGIYCDDDRDELWTIDEIKTTYRRLNSLRKPEPVHLAQAKCYAYIYAVENGLERVGVRMTYCNLITENIRYFHEEYTVSEITEWFDDLMQQYRIWAKLEQEWQAVRTESIKVLPFPYAYREGQKDLAAAVYRTIVHGRKLFLEAPTGTGKTIATLYPAIKSMGEGKAERIFYLTAKTITRTAAQDAVALMREHGLKAKSVTLTAKERICIQGHPACDPEHCPRAKGHYDRINDCLYRMLTSEDSFDRQTIEKYAEEFEVCPFELSLDLSLFSDVIIGDYNYLFDPHAYLRRFFGDGQGKGDYLFLIDEAHNLVDRGRDMFSASLCKEDILIMKRKVKEIYPKLEKKLSKCNKAMLELKKQMHENEKTCVLEEADAFTDSVRQLQLEIGAVMQENRISDQTGQNKKDLLWTKKMDIQEDLLQFYFDVTHFTDTLDRMDEHYRILSRIEWSGDSNGTEEYARTRFTVQLYCIDPSLNLQKCMDRGKAAILFSATFLPIQYYKSLLGGRDEDYEIYAHSVFDSRKRGLYIVEDVTSKYTRRSEEEYRRIARCIYSIIRERHGNYMAFFPSYAFMSRVAEAFEAEYETPETELLMQESGMREEDRESFLERFSQISDDRTLLGFCVLGGIFSEGIDLKNDSLIGAIIVGTGVPQVCAERELIKDYFDQNGQFGYDYAYRFPGMNKVLQAAGRVIRTQEDIGIIALLDERFLTPAYRRLFPREWAGIESAPSDRIGQKIERFWDEWVW